MATHLQSLLPVREIAVAAQALIDLLDALAGDPDLEDDDPPEDEHDRELVDFG